VPSLLAETIALPFGKNATAVTTSVWPRRMRNSSPVSSFQTLMVESALPETTRVPSADTAIDHTAGGTSHE
jgi:hypothetical protein